MNGVGAPQRQRTGFADADMRDLAGLDQSLHRADRLLDGHRWIDPVKVQKIDLVGAEPFRLPSQKR